MAFQLVEPELTAKIKVVGVGGGGGNAVNNMIASELQGVEFIAANTDAQVLERSRADVKIQLGRNLTKGLGAGAKPEVGREAAEEAADEIREALEGSDMVFITAGMGGGTGTGGAPVIAEISRELGALTVAVVTKPFAWEGKVRMAQAEEGIRRLKEVVDTIITIPNDRLRSLAEPNTPIIEMFKKADEVLYYAVRGISDLIVVHGYINVDFADVKTVMSEMGMALMGTGVGRGERRAMDAVRMAVANPLLEDISISGAKGILMNITASTKTMTMEEVEQASTYIQEEADDNANIIWGTVFDDSMGDDIRITVIATGIADESEEIEEVQQEQEEVVSKLKLSAGGLSVSDAQVSYNNKQRAYDDNLEDLPIYKAYKKGRSSKGTRRSIKDIEELEKPTFLRRPAD